MATVDNQQSWLPFDAGIGKDCSQGFCSIYCPQWCYSLFSPPPPLSLATTNDSSAAFSPLVVSIIAILASALLLVSYYTFVSKKCSSLFFTRRTPAVRHEDWHASPPIGLEQELIEKIAVLRYKREDASVVDGTECSVCLGEFKEGESLRLLPKCGHAFHLQCIDTWLKSHANCPLCRANIVVEEEMVEIVEEGGGDGGVDVVEIGEEDVERDRVEEEYVVAKNCGLVGSGNGRNWGLNCVMKRVRMKRSVLRGRFFLGRQGRGRSFLLPV